MVVERLDAPDLDAVCAGGFSVSTIAAATGSHGGSGSRKPSARSRSGNDGGSADEPTFQIVRSMSPTSPRISPVAARTAAGSSANRRWQTPAQRRSEPIVTQIPLVDDPLGALGRLDVEVRVLCELGERRSSRSSLTGCADVEPAADQALRIVLDGEPGGDECLRGTPRP